MSRPFEAQYPGRCALCDGEIAPGTKAAYIDDDLTHAGQCPGQGKRTETVCPRCQLVMPTSGVCGVCA